MALDLGCIDCQVGLSQIGQMALGFNCPEHGNIGLEISELMKIAQLNEMEKCCKDICPLCQKYGPPTYLKGPDTFKHMESLVTCQATLIRQRWQKEAE